ncbi:hypothetical protein GFS31_16080 [Leptolyngbya sp. BL0902]|uniref:sensor histidine kinase n=1 Tax=Leptolyngbya sp. BL0902 TaxID=1115757 RepID=UPI0018E7CD77|nr:HAMP domain-containing sensor histidine kinase [Leptolyngbya sp. BL0902]QQE64924.1 hypothetical protein GFS31_16080 [Leptolyngbya sp. BL0902]
MPSSASPSPFHDGADYSDPAPSTDPAHLADPVDFDILRLAYHRLQQQYHALAAFLGTASHELRAPINQVISLHQLILEDLCENPDEEREFIAQANQAIVRILKNLDTLIGLSKLDIGALEPAQTSVSLGKVLATVQRFTEMQCINRQCRLTVNPGPEPPQVLSDEHWLTQALLGLVEAALVAGSTAISLRLLDSGGTEVGHPESDDATVTLSFTCNAPASQWPPSAPSDLPQPAADKGAHPAISPSFRYHLAHRLLGHLHIAVRGTVWSMSDTNSDTNADQHTLTLTLPRASDNP